MVKTFDLKNKVVLVTGGYGYLGKAITESLAFHNAIVYVLGREESKFYETFKSIPEMHINFVSCDISDSLSIEKALENVLTEEGKIDCVINNAFYQGSIPRIYVR